MKYSKKLSLLVLAFCLVFPLFSLKAYAASGTITFSDPSVMVGDSVSVTVKVATTDGSPLGGVDLTLGYDASALEFKSGTSASGDSGTIRIAGVINDTNTTSLSYTLKFKSLKAGSSKITVSSYEIIDLNYAAVTMSKVGGSTVTAKTAPTVQASADCKLSSLQISPGTLSPGFSPTTVEYSATVPNSVTKLAVSATPNHAKASVTSVSGTNLSVGENTVKITVTAENGATVAYVIHVTRKEAEKAESSTKPESSNKPESSTKSDSSKSEDSTQQEEPKALQVTIGETTLIADSNIPKELVPSGFAVTDYVYKEQELSVLKSSDGTVTLFYLTDQQGKNGALYLYDENADSFSKPVFLQSNVTLLSLDFGNDVTIPEGFNQTTIAINDTDIVAYQNSDNTDFYLIYGMNAAGEKGWYSYDEKEGSLQRFSGVISTEATSGEDSSESSDKVAILQNQISDINKQYKSDLNQRTLIIFGLAALSGILLKLNDKKEDELEEGSEDFAYLEQAATKNEEEFEEIEKAAVKKGKTSGNKKKAKQKDVKEELAKDVEDDYDLEDDSKKTDSDFTMIDLEDENL